jgi:hypothetical protein
MVQDIQTSELLRILENSEIDGAILADSPRCHGKKSIYESLRCFVFGVFEGFWLSLRFRWH